MNHFFSPEFDKRYRKLSSKEQWQVDKAVQAFLKQLILRTSLPKGLGLKKLTASYWEIRASLDLRIIVELKDPVGFLLVGRHDDIRRFIREQ